MKVIQEFRAGDLVPEWLIDIAPNSADAENRTVAFDCDCAVVQSAIGRYWVIPEGELGYLIKVSNCHNISLRAVQHDVAIVTNAMRFTVGGEGKSLWISSDD
jgi:hypothetical protein